MSDRAIVLVSATTAIACARRDGRIVAATIVVVATVVALVTRSRRGSVGALGLVLVAVAVGAGMRSAGEWHAVTNPRLGAVDGWVRLVTDPKPYGSATRVVVEADRQRYEIWSRGRAVRQRVGRWDAGDRVWLQGERVALDERRQGRVAWEHVVGEIEVDWVGDDVDGTALDRASNRVRALLAESASTLPRGDGALFRGLVIGDDRDQPADMIERFRASGMSHLTAVSGQNIALMLAAVGPALRRLRAGPRLVATLGMIAWFASLTRFEPSVLRAGVMAGLSATAFALGRDRAPARLLCVAVTILLWVDPLLVRSIGLWLSVGATAGVVVAGPRLASSLRVLGPLASPVGITLGAQLGVAIPQLLVFGQLPLVALPANLLAVPVAGLVMLYGLPAGIVAGAVPAVAAVVMFPCRVGVRWVDTVAAVAARAEPGGTATWVGWLIATVFVVVAGAGRARHDRAERDRGP